MKREMVLGNRGTGKTTKLIDFSSETGYRLIVPSKNEQDSVLRQALAMNVSIPKPIDIKSVPKTIQGEGIIIDDPLLMFRMLFDFRNPIYGISLDTTGFTDITFLNIKEPNVYDSLV